MPINSDGLQLGPWLGGVRYDRPAEECSATELSDMLNTRVDQAGQVETRGGSLSYKTIGPLTGAPALTLCAEFAQDADTTYVVVAAGAVLYRYSSSSGGWLAITGTTTITSGTDNTFEWANANGTLVITNGTDTDAITWTGTGNATALDDNARFAKAKHTAWYDNRLWMANVSGAADRLWFSDTADIETWGATSFFNFGGIITGIVPSQNALVVHTTIGLFTLIPTGSATAPYRPNSRTQGAGIDGRSCVSLPNDKQLMLRTDGIYAWSGGAELEKISGPLDGERYWDNINVYRLRRAWALEYPARNEVWFGLPYGTSQSTMNHVIVYNRLLGIWFGPYTGWERNASCIIDDTPHLAGHDGVLYDSDTGDDDSGVGIAARFETGGPPPISADYKVRWLSVRMFFDAQGPYDCYVLQLAAGVDGETQTLSLAGGSFWLDVSYLDGPGILQGRQQAATDLQMLGYSPQTSVRVTMDAPDQRFAFYKMMLRYKQLGRFRKPPTVDT